MHKDLIMNFLVLNIKNLLIANALTESLALYSGSVLQASTPPPFYSLKVSSIAVSVFPLKSSEQMQEGTGQHILHVQMKQATLTSPFLYSGLPSIILMLWILEI